MNRVKFFRNFLEKILSIHRSAKLPRFASKTYKKIFKNIKAIDVSKKNKSAYVQLVIIISMNQMS